MFHYNGHTYTPIPVGAKVPKVSYMRIINRFDRIHPSDVGFVVEEANRYYTRDKKPPKKKS